MSEQNPYETLGVSRDASFEEIQDAKKRLSQQHRDNTKLVETIEAAYDSILMDRLKMRQEGRIKVPERIRFAERMAETPNVSAPNSFNASPPWLQNLMDTPSRGDILWPAGVFSALSLLTLLLQGNQGSFLPVALALGFFANLYFLTRKENRLGRAFLLTLGGLFIGIGLGMVLGNLLASSPDPIAGTMQLEGIVTFVVLWLISSFLR